MARKRQNSRSDFSAPSAMLLATEIAARRICDFRSPSARMSAVAAETRRSKNAPRTQRDVQCTHVAKPLSIRRERAVVMGGEDGGFGGVSPLSLRHFISPVDLQPLIRAALSSLKSDLQRHLADEQSALSTTVTSLVDGLVVKFRADPKMQAFVDEHVGQAIGTLIETNHALIGDLVASSLSPQKISDRDLVAQIEDRIGDDLQYIRLNGAIVGGVVGALIMAAKFMLMGF